MAENYPSPVGIAGAAGSGKDTVADYLALMGYQKVSFALPLKKALSVMFETDFVNMSREDKEKPLKTLGVTPRRLMQTLGTEWGRQIIDEDVWVKALDMHIQAQPPWQCFVVPDVRFPNEVQWIRDNGGILIFLERSGAVPVEAHASEGGVSPYAADVILKNDGTIAQIQQQALDVVSKRGFYAHPAPE